MTFNLKNKQILLVEDYSVMRATIREILYTLDVQKIEEVDNGNSAIKAMRHNKFDIVLCDYNLNGGKNGLNVLEEARHRNILPYNAVFIMVTAEQNPGMVLGAMECKPDEYLTKPFTPQQLISRLQRNCTRKEYITSVSREIAKDDLATAIRNCDSLLKKPVKKMRSELLKLRAELAIKIGDFDTAKALINGVLQERELTWARLSLGKINFLQGDIIQAAAVFEQIIAQNPMLMEAYDWLAKVYEANDELLDAQEILSAAVDISPQNILRQKKLAAVADRTGNLEIAKNAYLAAVNLGKQSVHKSCRDFSCLAKIYHQTDATTDALKTLDDMRQEFINNVEAELRAATLETELFQAMGDSKLSAQAFNNALSLSQQFDQQIPKDLRLDMAKACYLNDNPEQAESILESLVKNNIDDEIFIDAIKAMYQSIDMENHAEELIKQTKRTLIEINNKGVNLFKQGKLSQSLMILEEAVSKMPENKTIILNIIKILLHDMSVSGCTEAKMDQAKAYIDRASKLGVADEKVGSLKIQLYNLR